jgi:hypothetical protein
MGENMNNVQVIEAIKKICDEVTINEQGYAQAFIDICIIINNEQNTNKEKNI